MMKFSRVGGAIVGLACVVLAGCGGSATPADLLARQKVSTMGGTIEVPSLSLTLTIPPGSVKSDTVFSIFTSTRTAPSGAIGSVVRFEPEGMEFDPPLELSYALNTADLATDAYPERLEIVTYKDNAWTKVGNEITEYDADASAFSIMAYVPHFSDWAIRDSGLTGALYGIHGSDVSALTAAGEAGLVRYASGTSTVESTPSETWFDYYADGTTEYLVGTAMRTTVLRTRPVSGGPWVDSTIPAPNTILRGIHGSGNTIIAVGFLGRILVWDGSTWQLEIAVEANVATRAAHLYDVQVFPGGTAIAVGTNSTVLVRNAGTWKVDEQPLPAALGTRLVLRGVWGTSTSDYYVVGFSKTGGVILHRTPSGWITEHTEPGKAFYGVAGSATNTHFVGAGISIRRSAAGTYTEDNLVDSSCAATNQNVTLNALFVDASDSFVAVGSNGKIVSNLPCGVVTPPPPPPPPPPIPLPIVGAGGNFTCALLTSRGAVRCWGGADDGDNPPSNGQLGYGPSFVTSWGDTEYPSTAGDVPLGGTVASLSVGRSSSCAIMSSNGALRCWGAYTRAYGILLGDFVGDNETPATAGDVNLGGTAVAQVVNAAHHICALLVDGNVRCWGVNNVGELGNGNNDWIEDPSLAGNVTIGGTVLRLEAGDYHVCALLMGGGVRCWGDGSDGQLGYGNTNAIGDNELPLAAGDLPLGEPAVDIAIGAFHSCALLQSGAVKCWGQGSEGQLGYANKTGQVAIPAANVVVTTTPGRSVVDLVAGFQHTCALLDNGAVTCWGLNESGQLGYARPDNVGDNETPASAGTVDVGGTVVQLSANRYHTCAVLATGGIRCWGLNTAGQLGYNGAATIGDNEVPSTAGDIKVE